MAEKGSRRGVHCAKTVSANGVVNALLLLLMIVLILSKNTDENSALMLCLEDIHSSGCSTGYFSDALGNTSPNTASKSGLELTI